MSATGWIVRRKPSCAPAPLPPEKPAARVELERLEPRVLASASMLGPALTIASQTSSASDIAVRRDGSAVVVWSSGSGNDLQIEFQRIGSDGSAEPAQLLAGHVGNTNQLAVAVSNAADGNFVIGWSESNNSDVLVQAFAANGQAVSDILILSQNAYDLKDVAMALDGSFAVVWGSSGISNLRLFGSDGAAKADPVQVEQPLSPNDEASFSATGGASVTMDDAGDVVVAYQRENYRSRYVTYHYYGYTYQQLVDDLVSKQVVFQRFDADGQSKGPQQVAYTTTNELIQLQGARVSAAADGSFWVGWMQKETRYLSEYDYDERDAVMARRYSASGAAQGGIVPIISASTAEQLAGIMDLDVGPQGDLVAISRHNDGNSTSTVFRRFPAKGAADGPAQRMGVTGALPQAVSLDGQGNFGLLYTTDNGLFLQRYSAPKPNLAVSFGAITPFPALVSGQNLASVPVVVANDSTLAASGTGTVTLSATPAATPDDTSDDIVLATLENQSFAVAGGRSKTFSFRNLATTALADGQYLLQAVIQTSGIDGNTDDNQAVSDTLTVAPPFVDLSGNLLSSTLSTVLWIPGDRGRVSVSIRNNGNIKATGKFDLYVYARPDGEGDDILLGALLNQNLALNAGAAKTLNVNVVVPGTALPENYSLVARVVSDQDDNPDNDWMAATEEGSAIGNELVWVFGQVGTRKNVKLVLLDDDDTDVTFSLSGLGTGWVSDLDGWNLTFLDTTNRSSVKIGTSGGGDAVTLLSGIFAGELNGFEARTSDLQGEAQFTTLKNLTLRDITDSSVELEGDLGSLTARMVDVLSVHTLGAIGRLRLVDANFIAIEAQRIADLTVTGDARLGVAGNLVDSEFLLFESPNGQSLGKLTVKGALTGSAINTDGSVGAITANVIEESQILVGTMANFPTAREDFIAQSALASVTVKGLGLQAGAAGFINSVIDAWSIGSANLKLINEGVERVSATRITSLSYSDSSGVRSFRGLSGDDPADLTAVALTELDIDLL